MKSDAMKYARKILFCLGLITVSSGLASMKARKDSADNSYYNEHVEVERDGLFTYSAFHDYRISDMRRYTEDPEDTQEIRISDPILTKHYIDYDGDGELDSVSYDGTALLGGVDLLRGCSSLHRYDGDQISCAQQVGRIRQYQNIWPSAEENRRQFYREEQEYKRQLRRFSR